MIARTIAQSFRYNYEKLSDQFFVVYRSVKAGFVGHFQRPLYIQIHRMLNCIELFVVIEVCYFIIHNPPAQLRY